MTTQLEAFEKRINKIPRLLKEEKKKRKLEVLNLRKIAILFRACGSLWDTQADRLEKNL